MRNFKKIIKKYIPPLLLIQSRSIRSTIKRKVFKENINLSQLLFDLRTAGFKDGDMVMIHSSLSKIGNVLGGANTIINSFIEIIGEKGTILMPCYNSATEVEKKSFNNEYIDLRIQPAETGKITEIFRNFPGVLRSSHPFSSVCGQGSKAEFVLSDHASSAYICHKNSPIARLANLNGKIVGIGVPLGPGMGIGHCLEDIWDKFPFEVHSDSFIAKYIDFNGCKVERGVFRYNPKVAETRIDQPKGQWICEKLTKHFVRKKIMKIFTYGKAPLWCMDAHEVFNELKRLALKGVTMYLTEENLDMRNRDVESW